VTDDHASSPSSRRILGRLIGAGIVGAAVIAVIVTLLQWETRPQTDDATVRANFVGIAPQVNGHIVELRVRDNQQVKQGDLLFLIDPRPYEIALARALAALALTRKEVEGLRNGVSSAASGVAKAAAQLDASAADVRRRESDPVAADAEIARLEAQRVASEAALRRAQAELKQAGFLAGAVASPDLDRSVLRKNSGRDPAVDEGAEVTAPLVQHRIAHLSRGARACACSATLSTTPGTDTGGH
jgi:multidrug efflux system membrane fusion protein